MKKNYDMTRQYIYDLVCGNLEEQDTPESRVIQNEFAEGGECTRAYSEMLDAYSRICQRLGTEEWNDPDVEIVVNELLRIGKHIALTMFDYGALFGNRAQR